MILYAVTRRGAALLLLVMLCLGQPGSLCALHCLFDLHGAHVAQEAVVSRVVAARPSETAPEAPAGHATACQGTGSQLSHPVVPVTPIGPMAVTASTLIAAVPVSLNDVLPAEVLAPDDLFPSRQRPPPRA